MKPRKLLLAEDDKDDQHLFNDYLQDRDDIVLMPIVENGVALFDLLDKIADHDGLPDLIILDQNMPKKKRPSNASVAPGNEPLFAYPGSCLFHIYRPIPD